MPFFHDSGVFEAAHSLRKRIWAHCCWTQHPKSFQKTAIWVEQECRLSVHYLRYNFNREGSFQVLLHDVVLNSRKKFFTLLFIDIVDKSGTIRIDTSEDASFTIDVILNAIRARNNKRKANNSLTVVAAGGSQ